MAELARNQKLTTRQVDYLRSLCASHASAAIRRLGDCVAGDVRLTGTQVAAARVLLAKCLPDLSQVSVEHSGDTGLQISIVRHSETPGADTTVTPLPRAGEGDATAPRALHAVTVDGEADSTDQG